MVFSFVFFVGLCFLNVNFLVFQSETFFAMF